MSVHSNTGCQSADWPMHLQYPLFTVFICDDINIAFFTDTNPGPHWMNTWWFSAREGSQGKIVQTTISQPEPIICSKFGKLGVSTEQQYKGMAYIHLTFCTLATRLRFARSPRAFLTFPPRIWDNSATSWEGTTSWFLEPISTCGTISLSAIQGQTISQSTYGSENTKLVRRNIS